MRRAGRHPLALLQQRADWINGSNNTLHMSEGYQFFFKASVSRAADMSWLER